MKKIILKKVNGKYKIFRFINFFIKRYHFYYEYNGNFHYYLAQHLPFRQGDLAYAPHWYKHEEDKSALYCPKRYNGLCGDTARVRCITALYVLYERLCRIDGCST